MIDPYLRVISNFNRYRVDYIVIGVSGINYYVSSSAQIILTADYDIFIRPDVNNVRHAIKVMRSLDYEVTTADGSIKRIDISQIEKIVREKKTLICENPTHNLVELCLKVSGFSFGGLEKNKKIFRADRIKIMVASLKDMLRMKEIANRPKDRLFLQRYVEVLKEKERSLSGRERRFAKPLYG